MAGRASAASLEFLPTHFEMAPSQSAISLEVLNRGGGTTAAQVRPFVWTQHGDNDELTPTDDVVVSPPIFTVPEGESQVIRVLLRIRSKGGSERYYRLLIDQVPPPAQNHQVVFAIRASIPIFVDSADGGRAELRWRAERTANGQIVFAATNTGRRYAAIESLQVALPDGKRGEAQPMGQNSYVLPGAERRWTSPDRGSAGRGGQVHVTVSTTQAGRVEQDIPLPP